MNARKPLLVCLCLLALFAVGPGVAQGAFGIKPGSLSVAASNRDGSATLQAGATPYEYDISLTMNQDGAGRPEGTLRELVVELPPGLVGNPLATPRCPDSQFSLPGQVSRCPGGSQVGIARVKAIGQGTVTVPVYNLVPPLGQPARIGFTLLDFNSFQEASLRSGSDFGISVSDITIPTNLEIQSVRETIWGVPADPGHDRLRFCPANAGVPGCSTDAAPKPFLSMPTSCTGPLRTTVSVSSLENPAASISDSVESLGDGGNPAGITGCADLPFSPDISVQPETEAADAPTGLQVDLHVPQTDEVIREEGELEAADELQILRVSASSGLFRLGLGGQGTSELSFEAPASEVQAALQGLSAIGAGNVRVSGGPGGTAPYEIAFTGALAQTNVPKIETLFLTPGGRAEITVAREGQEPGELGTVGFEAVPATANLRDTVVTLPAGLTVNPSAANGLVACPLSGPEGINLPGSGEPAAAEPAKCPAASNMGTVAVETPVLDHPLPGTIYLAQQGANPFGSLLALYIAVHDPATGVVVKLAGKVEPDPVTGQLKATFQNNPQLPFEDFSVDFTGGPRAALTTPPTCGTYTTQSVLTPWSAPQAPSASPSDSFDVTRSARGGACATSEAGLPNDPSFEAGTVEPLAASYSPFVLKLERRPGSQKLQFLNVTLPPGLTGKLAGVAECSDAQIAVAQARSGLGQGALERQSPSCPASSEVGIVNVGAGSGSPLFVQGRAYLAGPYKGAPLSMVIITPAIAGPFDLGTVVVRAALEVDQTSAQITARSDQIPTILHGLPLDVRSIAIQMNRPKFTLNPTSCNVFSIDAAAVSTLLVSSPLSQRFQVGGCRGLAFGPKLSLSLKGATKRTGHPAFKAILTQPQGQANVGRVMVALPPTEFIDPIHVSNPCTRAEFSENRCPASSVLGKARVTTPLLDKPLQGKVYFRANGGARELPDIVVDLRGQVRIVLVGFVDSITRKGSEASRVRTIFASPPDAPFTKFVLEMKGGKKHGLLVNSANICKTSNRALVKLRGQNGKSNESKPRIATSCRK